MNINVENLCLWHGDRPVFNQLNWALTPRQWTCLLGQSGVGKSSLLRLIAGLLPENSRIQGKIQAPLKQLAYLGQNDALLPWLSVFDNAAFSARIGPYSAAEKRIIRERAAELLQRVGLKEALQLYPRHLSGGMRQRVALVRALAEDKPVVLMDEPFSRLDAVTRHQLQNLAAELLRNKTVLFVTHDPAEALRLGDGIDLLSGCPATIKTLVKFSRPGPRELNSLELLNLQKKLYQALLDNHGGTVLYALHDELNLKTAT